jgi:hypothetical protein
LSGELLGSIVLEKAGVNGLALGAAKFEFRYGRMLAANPVFTGPFLLVAKEKRWTYS